MYEKKGSEKVNKKKIGEWREKRERRKRKTAKENKRKV